MEVSVEEGDPAMEADTNTAEGDGTTQATAETEEDVLVVADEPPA